MKHLYKLLLGIGLFSPGCLWAQVSGRVYQDTNLNGKTDEYESAVPGLIVKAFDRSGQLVAQTTSASDGRYYLTVEAGQPLRLEFSGIETGWHVTPGHKAVQFLTAPAEAHLGLYNPKRFVGTSAQAVQTVFVNGDYSGAGADTLAALVRFSANGRNRTLQRLATPKQVGSIWALSYDRSADRLFLASLAKRHSGFGPLGSGGIYQLAGLNQKGNAKELTSPRPFVSLDQLGFPTAPVRIERDLKGWITSVSHDSTMFALVGKMSLGGMALSDNGQTLYVMNLYDRQLYRLNLPPDGSAPKRTDIQAYPLPSLSNASGELRPFAVHYHDGAIYVGGVWDASHSNQRADLTAVVLRLDPTSGRFRQIFSTRLDYSRGTLAHGVSGWQPWTDNPQSALVANTSNWLVYPQPILADIEFDADGSMVLGLMDRLGHQTGDGQLFRSPQSLQLEQYRGLSGGDVLRVARYRQRYQLEDNARLDDQTTGSRRTLGANNHQGPGGGEFYLDDQFQADGVTWHQETALGGLALLPETGELLVASREPLSGQYLTGGVKWFSNQTGQAKAGLALFGAGGQPGYLWKGNNVGDIALIPAQPPIELGDRIWQDTNGNGLQDADEPGLAGLELQLHYQGKAIASTQTDEAGYYHFYDSMVTGGIQPYTAYQIHIKLDQPRHPGLSIPSQREARSEFLTDLPAEVDNNAYMDGRVASIDLTTGAAGQALHGLDAGLCIPSDLPASINALRLTPNPASSQTQLVYQGKAKAGEVRIVLQDMAGKVRQTLTAHLRDGVYQHMIDVSALEAGQYIVTLTENGITNSRTLLKQ